MNELFQKSGYYYIDQQIFNYLSPDGIINTRWLQSEDVKNNTKYFNYKDAISDNNYINIKYLTYHIKFTEDIFPHAAEIGNLMILKLLLVNDCKLNTDTFRSAAKNGNLDNMKWLKQNNCPWDIWTLMMAVDKENLENIEWLFQNGCTWHNYQYNINYPSFRSIQFILHQGIIFHCYGRDNNGHIIWYTRDGRDMCDNIIIYALSQGKPEIANLFRRIIHE
jgi:hypothetical protein